MAIKALEGIDRLRKKKKVVKAAPKRVVAEEIDAPEEEEQAEPVIVRIPRTTPSSVQGRVDKLSDGEALVDDGKLGKSIETQSRRQEVTGWMLNGHTYDGELCTVPMLAKKLQVPVATINMDVVAIKERMAEFYTKEDDSRDIAALAHMLLEMKFRDRGQALLLYNRVLADLAAADAAVETRKRENRFSKLDGFGAISGRDRAAMYSTALAAIDLANRTTNGMESLLKLTGGAQKLQLIIKAKNLHLANQNNTFNTNPLTVQSMIESMMSNVLPSSRNQNKQLQMPDFLELDTDDQKIMSVAEENKAAKKVIDAKS